MKASELFYPTLREVPSEAEIISHQLLLRAGYIRKSSTGIYTYLPLAYRVIKKISNIVREEMDRATGQEILMPIIQNKELWEASGRWNLYGDEMFRLKDRHDREFALAPTHEELVTTLIMGDVHSYRDLPLLLYQIQNKYRDEIRPRYGLMRGREFIMKDLYTFDIDEEAMNESYQKMYKAYTRIFSRLGLDFRVVEADSGAIGGDESHEFIVLADNGESLIVYCEKCSFAANVEKAECISIDNTIKEEMLTLEKVSTPEQKTIQDLVSFLDIEAKKQLKTLFYMADGELIAVLLRGDRELNELKLKNALELNELFMADETLVEEKCGAKFGSLGPVGLKLKVVADKEVAHLSNSLCGANEDNYHYKNVNVERDFNVNKYIDIRSAGQGDLCPQCQDSLLKEIRGIEVGHIFKLGDKYSKAMGATYLNKEGIKNDILMGCYGIGISRTMAAAIEQKYDGNGMLWPIAIAPYQVILIPVNTKKEDQMEAAYKIYNDLIELGIEVMIDDRDERAGVKFKDADLIGIPLRITIGPKSLQENKVELKKRNESENSLISIDLINSTILDILKEN